MNTLLLDVGTWDLCSDASGNIASAADPYAIAQDGASAIRTFLGEVWYDDTLGVNYKGQILGKNPPVSLLQELMANAVFTCRPTTADVYVVSATCIITSWNIPTRTVVGSVNFVDSTGGKGSITI